ncbi:hypothetical protein MRB53_034116 [Persea americana]|uniref:Uncharacterized protein n=1 Tax=Persea americana TaxID=3435 RepID=A0ACC2KWD9_PERAE|nr:hypothetical protein MRB53_034116 [Persea americana]
MPLTQVIEHQGGSIVRIRRVKAVNRPRHGPHARAVSGLDTQACRHDTTQEAPNPETIEHALWAIYALSTSTTRALSSSPSAAEFLPQLAELIRQGGSTELQHISVSLICNLSLADKRKRVLARCMGTLVKMTESPLQKSTAVGT